MTDTTPPPVQRPGAQTGLRLRLRPVELSDAAYIHGLRTDPRYNTHLSAVTGTVDDQRDWIARYLTREAEGTEVYFVIERLADGLRCGVVRLYDIGAECFTWGSWILDANKPSKAALESAILIYRIGFDVLGLSKAVFDVRRDNERTIAFHRRFGAAELRQDVRDIYFSYSRERFEADRERYDAMLCGTGSG